MTDRLPRICVECGFDVPLGKYHTAKDCVKHKIETAIADERRKLGLGA